MDIPLASPVIDDEMRAAVDEVLRTEYMLGGPSVSKFEDEFAEYVGTKHAIAVSSGTQALHLTLQGLGIGEGDTVITTPATFIATGNTIVRTGATPHFVDVSLDTYTIDTDALARAVEELDNVAAIMPIHLYGYPAEMSEIKNIAGDIPVITDSCQAHGATYHGERVGSIGDAAGFSFYPSKNMVCGGDGGMITTDDDKLAAEIRTLRNVGRGPDGQHQRIGYTARLDTTKAAIGRKQLKRLDDWNSRRRAVAEQYTDELAGIEDLVLPPTDDETRSCAWYMYVVRTPYRDELSTHLNEQGIGTGIHYEIPIHQQPPYREMGYGDKTYPDAEEWSETVLSLPVHQNLTDTQVETVINEIRNYFREI